jgi:regulator of sigma E protease
VTLTIRRPDGTDSQVTITPEPSEKPAMRLGLESISGRVAELRSTPLVAATGLRKDDQILAVNDQPVLRSYDFVRALARVEAAPEVDGRKLRIRVERNGSEITLEGPVLGSGDALRLVNDVAVQHAADTSVVAVTPGSAAEAAGIRSGDRIARIEGKEVTGFKDILEAGRRSKADAPVSIAVERGVGDARETFTASVVPNALPQPVYGFNFREATYIYKADNPLEAVQVGMASSWKLVKDSWVTLKRILLGSVSGSNIGGIITIGVVSHSWASDGIAKLLFFLCMLSVNLAFLNVLPIPVLDGGHLFFLLIEKI